MSGIGSAASSQTPVTGIEGVVDAVAVRQTYLNHESSVRSIGILYYIAGTLFGLLGTAGVFVEPEPSDEPELPAAVVVGLCLVLGVGYLLVGRGLRKLRPWSRIVSAVFAAIGLLGFPVGTLINGYILYLLFSEKGEVVFSEKYRQVIDATPEIKYKTSGFVWFLLIFMLFLLGLLVLLALLPE